MFMIFIRDRGDVVEECVVEEVGLLVDVTHEPAQVVDAHLSDVGAVDGD